MCVKLVKTKSTIVYDMNRPLEDQIKGCKQVVIDFKPADPSMEKFLDEIERFAKTGKNLHLNVKVIHHDQVMGAKLKKQVNKVKKDLNLNEFIKLVSLTFDNTDRKLEELSLLCNGEDHCPIKR